MGIFGNAFTRSLTPTANALAQYAPLAPRNGGAGSVRDPIPNQRQQQARPYRRNPAETLGDVLATAFRATGQMPGEARRTAQTAVDFSPVGQMRDLRDGGYQAARGVQHGSKAETLGGVLAMVLAGAPVPKPVKAEARGLIGKGIKAFHGSPYDFDRFSVDKIGTGEGAQAYGHGLYFAESPEVARGYRDKLAGQTGAETSAELAHRILDEVSGDRDTAIALANERLNQWLNTNPKYRTPDGYERFIEAKRHITNGTELGLGRMYEVGISANPEQLLNWDVPMSKQPEAVRRGFDEIAGRVNRSDPNIAAFLERVVGDQARGASIYRAPNIVGAASDVPATEFWRERGVPGVQYLDQGSRGVGDGTRNYVIFDDSLINILRKYGIAGGMLAGGTAATLAQSQRPSEL